MPTRRDLLTGTAALAALAAGTGAVRAQDHSGHAAGGHGGHAPARSVMRGAGAAPSAATRSPVRRGGVVTLNGGSLAPRMAGGVKEFRLTAEPVKREFAPGMVVNCWGYNGETPGPTIEATVGDRVRIFVKNALPEWTTVHWHGLRLPNGMDGVGGLTQPHIPPGKTGIYEFTLRDAGTFMYHPHADEMVQMAMGMMGMFIVHPPGERTVDRDYAIMLSAWDVKPGTAIPQTATMLDFNLWSFNSRVFPGIDPMVAGLGERVRIRVGNLSMTSHPIHLHGQAFRQTATDGGPIPPGAQWPMTSMNVPVGSTATMEFTADEPGDWAFHCHKAHHTMNAMGHDVPNDIGVNMAGMDRRVNRLLPDYMSMGSTGMAEMAAMKMQLPENTLPMMAGTGPFGPLEMGGMFTVLKVRRGLGADDYRDPGWYAHPAGTVCRIVDS